MMHDPVVKKFKVWTGADFLYTFTYLSALPATPKDLTGYSATMPIKDEPNGSTLMTLSTVDNTIVLGNTSGTVSLHIPAATTATIIWNSGTYELFLTSPTNITDVILRGTISVISF